MDKPIPEAVELLREVSEQLEGLDCGACVGSMAPMEDLHGRIAAYLALTAAQQQGQAVAWIGAGHLNEQRATAARAGYGMPLVASTARRGEDCIPLYTAPPSAPVGVDVTERIAVLTAHRACHSAEHDPENGRLHGYCIVCGVPFPCEYVGPPPAQQPAADRETEFATIAAGADCPACGETGPCGCKGYGQQPAAVDEAMTQRIMSEFHANDPGDMWPPDEQGRLRRKALQDAINNAFATHPTGPRT